MGVYDLGLTSDQFWGLTLAQFGALIDRHVVRERQEDYRPGVLASVIWNANPFIKGKAKQPWNFFPSLKVVEAETPRRESTAEQMLAILEKAYPAPIRKTTDG